MNVRWTNAKGQFNYLVSVKDSLHVYAVTASGLDMPQAVSFTWYSKEEEILPPDIKDELYYNIMAKVVYL